MAQHTENPVIERLAALVGEWAMVPHFKGLPPADVDARVVFEWMPGKRFLIQRWEIPVPEAPDGIAIIGADPESEGNFLQHYFDSRGVARVYRMSLSDAVWKLWRDSPDFSSLDFSQRYDGTFSDEGRTISGCWEICHDGKTWEHDFDLTYTKLTDTRPPGTSLGL
ncbi:MAG: hypothetical protein QOJ46_2362 [bacterium]|jgi:hypothetical protein